MCDNVTLQDTKEGRGHEELRWHFKTLYANTFSVFNFMFKSCQKKFANHTDIIKWSFNRLNLQCMCLCDCVKNNITTH